MSSASHIMKPDRADAMRALEGLCGDWLAGTAGDGLTLLTGEEVPAPFNHLLVHHEHMTEVLHRYYQKEVNLHVQQSDRGPESYRRRIVLTAGPMGPVTELGIVRLHLPLLPPPVQDEILAQLCPLGAILIRYQLLRRIAPRYYGRFEPHSPVVGLFDIPFTAPVYGRLATIFCNDQPAIELLEIVTGSDRSPS